MKENYTQLYPNEQVATAVGDYSFEHSTKLPKHVTDHHAWGVASQEKANYMISPLQAQFQVWMAKAVGARRSKFLFLCGFCRYCKVLRSGLFSRFCSIFLEIAILDITSDFFVNQDLVVAPIAFLNRLQSRI